MRMPHYNANKIHKRILTSGDLNWVQHWVSRIGLSLKGNIKEIIPLPFLPFLCSNLVNPWVVIFPGRPYWMDYSKLPSEDEIMRTAKPVGDALQSTALQLTDNDPTPIIAPALFAQPNFSFTSFFWIQEQGLSHFEVDLRSMRSTMRALEDELGTPLVARLSPEDQQEVLLLSTAQYSTGIKVSGKLPTYPSPKSTLTVASHLGQMLG